MLRPAAIGFVFLAACASAPPAAPGPEAVQGCWIERRAGGETRTMRWFPDGGVWRGEAVLARDSGGRSTELRLERQGAGWRICSARYGRSIQSSCAPAVFGAAPPADEDAWSEIYASPDRLKMVGRMRGAAPRTIIDAARDGCD